MEKGSSNSEGGLGCASILTIVFIVLKLTGNIDWSWVWVLSPIWISVLLVVGFYLAIGFIAGIMSWWEDNIHDS